MKSARIKLHLSLMAAALVSCALSSSCSRSPASPAQHIQIVVTTSLLESAVRDVGGNDFHVFRLVPPGSCPGHFDATPADLERIVNAPLFIRHDYQSALDAKLGRAGKRPRRCLSIPDQGAQTIPANYLAVCRQTCDALCALLPDKARALKSRLAQTVESINLVASKTATDAAPLRGKAVITSRLQADFCRWLGLTVAATFDNGDQASLRGIEQAIKQARESGAKAVVCNLQRGLREGQVLAERLGLPLIILSNFPETRSGKGGYPALLRGNVNALLRGISRE